MIRHVSNKTLAGYGSGDLGARRAAAVRRHLFRCARCRQHGKDLEAVSAALAAAEVPPMPDHVLSRIDNALAAEAAHRSGKPVGAGSPAVPQPGVPVADAGRQASGRPGRPARRKVPRRPRLPAPVAVRLAAAAAAVVVLAGGGFAAWQAIGPRAGFSGAAGTGGPVGPAVPAGRSITVPYQQAGQAAVVIVRSTGQRFEPGTLQSSVQRDLKAARYGAVTSLGRTKGPAAAGQAPTASSGQKSLRIGPLSVRALPGCISRVAAGHEILLAETGYYQGQPVMVIVRADPGGGTGLWVVGPGCSAANSDVIAHQTLRR